MSWDDEIKWHEVLCFVQEFRPDVYHLIDKVQKIENKGNIVIIYFDKENVPEWEVELFIQAMIWGFELCYGYEIMIRSAL